jgi:hypothetical protein
MRYTSKRYTGIVSCNEGVNGKYGMLKTLSTRVTKMT